MLHHFLSKCVEQFDELEPQALPALMHQLLLLVNNQGAVAQRLVLGSIVRHFDGLDARSLGETGSAFRPNCLRSLNRALGRQQRSTALWLVGR